MTVVVTRVLKGFKCSHQPSIMLMASRALRENMIYG